MTVRTLTPMHRFVVEQLQGAKGRWRQIANRTLIPYGTLRKIADLQRRHPSITNVETLAMEFGWRFLEPKTG